MFCPNCGTQNPDYFVYCKNCSEPLPQNPPKQKEEERRRSAGSGSSIDIANAKGPAYVPRQRHNAIDPWEMLRQDEVEEPRREKSKLDELIEKKPPYEGRVNRSHVSVPEPTVKPRQHKMPDAYFSESVIKPAADFARRSREADEWEEDLPAGGDELKKSTMQAEVFDTAPKAAQSNDEAKKSAAPAEPASKAVHAVELPEETVPEKTMRFERPGRLSSAPLEKRVQSEPERTPVRAEKPAFASKKTPATPVFKESAAEKKPVTAKAARDEDLDDLFEPMGRSSRKAKKNARALEDKGRSVSDDLLEENESLRADKKKSGGHRAIFAKEPEKDFVSVPDDFFDEKTPKKSRKQEVLDVEDGGEEQVDEGKRSPLLIMIWVLVALLAAAVVFLAYRFFSEGGFSSLFGTEQEQPDQQVVIEETEYEGQAAHTITVYGEDGSTVEFIDPTTGETLQTATMENGGYRLTVVDLNWIPDDASDLSVISVTPVIYVTPPEGERTQITAQSFNITIPTLTLNLTEPDLAAPVQVEGDTLTLSGTVDAGSPVQLYWNGQSLDAQLDTATGTFAAQAPISADVSSYELRARLARHADAVVTIELDRTVTNIELSATASAASTQDAQVTISGTTEAGATVTVDGTVSGDVTVNADGTFSFTADLSSGYGIHDFVINASSSNGSATQTVSVIHSPDIDEYSRHAQEFDYSRVYNNPTDTKGITYLVKGTVASIEQADGYQIVIVNADGDESKKVMLYYFSDSILSEGTSYSFFADANGNTELTEDSGRMPMMNAWYASRS